MIKRLKRNSLIAFALILLGMNIGTEYVSAIDNSSPYSRSQRALPKIYYRKEYLEAEYKNEDFPPAIVLTADYNGDGTADSKIPSGTVLFRRLYEGIYAYSPMPPDEYITSSPKTITRADGTRFTLPANTRWLNPALGPNSIYSQAEQGASSRQEQAVFKIEVHRDTSATDSSGNSFTIGEGTYTNEISNNIHIIGYTSQGVYLRHPNASTKSVLLTRNYTKIEYDNIFVNGYDNNLKRYGVKPVELGYGYFYKSENTTHPLYSGTPITGEWRYIGFDLNGDLVPNPRFPADIISHNSVSNYRHYLYAYNPWDTSIFAEKIGTKSSYDNDTSSNGLKWKAINKALTTPDAYGINLLGSSTQHPNGGTVNYWMNRLSLRTNPEYEGTMFAGARQSGDRYRVIQFSADALRDLYVQEIEVIGRGANNPSRIDVIAEYKRTRAGDITGSTYYYDKLIPGETYYINVFIRNNSNREMIASRLNAHIADIKLNGSTTNQYASLSQIEDMNNNITHIQTASTSGNLYRSDISNAITTTFSVPLSENVTNYDVHAFVGRSHWGVDNNNASNDKGYLSIEVSQPNIAEIPCVPGEPDCGSTTGACRISNHSDNNTGDLSITSIELINVNTGNTDYKKTMQNGVTIQNAIKPNSRYKIKINGEYTGNTQYNIIGVLPSCSITNTIDECFNLETRYEEVEIAYSIERKLGYSDELEYISKTATTGLYLENGKEFSIITDEIFYDRPWGKVTAKITGVGYFNPNLDNDCLSATIDDNYDIKISNAKVIPESEYVQGSKDIVLNVVYDANVSVPNYVTDYKTQIKTQISLGNTSITVYDQLSKGNNTGLSHKITVPAIGQNQSLTGSVILNSTKESYEHDVSLGRGNYDNNSATINSNIKLVASPTTKFTKPTGTVQEYQKGGDANNNCMIPRTQNSWTTSHRVLSWTSSTYTYNSLNPYNNKTYSYRTYNNNSSNSNKQYTEKFEITKVMFRSKVTKDKNLGALNDGWVNLLSPSEKDLGLIKAGYGFELEITSRYSTNASNPANDAINNNGQSGTLVANKNIGINLNNDIFLELPGNSSTRKILATKEYSGAKQGLNVTSKSGVDSNGIPYIEYIYTIKPTSTVVSSVGKIYIPDTMKDGDFELNIFTPPQTGVSNFDKSYTRNSNGTLSKKYTALCDRKKVVVKVSGSATDDLNSHENQ